MSNLPWFKDGLKFKCTGCGKCCTGGPGFVWVNESEIEKLAHNLSISTEMFKRRYTRLRENKLCLTEKKSDQSCIFLKDNRCTVYLNRPQQCQTYPWWKENLKSKESWLAAAEFCEGISENAPLVPFEDFKDILNSDN